MFIQLAADHALLIQIMQGVYVACMDVREFVIVVFRIYL